MQNKGHVLFYSDIFIWHMRLSNPDLQAYGLLGPQTAALMDYWTLGLSGLRLLDPLTIRHMDHPALRLANTCTNVPLSPLDYQALNYWTLGQMNTPTIGPQTTTGRLSDYHSHANTKDFGLFGLVLLDSWTIGPSKLLTLRLSDY